MNNAVPLATRMRPQTLDDIVGQSHLTEDGSPLRTIESGASATSVILWGPPGTGKTTIAYALAHIHKTAWVPLSATSTNVKELRETINKAHDRRDKDMTATIVFLDEIHRFTRSQQDVLLPALGDGTITLIGATTENPSFSINAALLSRSLQLSVKPLSDQDITTLIDRALNHPNGLPGTNISDEAKASLARLAAGDARVALTYLEQAAALASSNSNSSDISIENISAVAGKAALTYDRNGDQHYDIVSAWIKSMRGSDVNASLHWLARMIDAGEDGRFIARRLIVHASEDIGMADSSVLPLAVAAAHAVQLVGMPEARIPLAHATIAVASAPKSNAVIAAINASLSDIQNGTTGTVPAHLRDAHYPGAAALGHGDGYLYPHNFPDHVVPQQYLPDNLQSQAPEYYRPTDSGFEQIMLSGFDTLQDFIHSTKESS